MARKVSMIVAAAPTTFAMDLDQIPADIREEVEQAYAAIKENPRSRVRAEFDEVAEAKQYLAYVIAYCNVRPAGAIRYRKSPTKGLPDTVVEFRITDVETEAERQTREIRAAAKAAAKAANETEVAKPKPSPKGK